MKRAERIGVMSISILAEPLNLKRVNMDPSSFRDKMMKIDRGFSEERFEEVLTATQALAGDILSQPLFEAENLCWPLYYELRSLHALKRWSEVTAFMRDKAAMLHVIGPQNSAYAYSLTMEAAAQAGELDELPEWAYWCFYYRLCDDDQEALQLAIMTSKNLAQMFGRAELFPEVLDKLGDVAERFEDLELSDFARQWADKERRDLALGEG